MMNPLNKIPLIITLFKKKKISCLLVSNNIGLCLRDVKDIMDRKNTKNIRENNDKNTKEIREEIKIILKLEANKFLKTQMKI